jgi:hypothetical protein
VLQCIHKCNMSSILYFFKLARTIKILNYTNSLMISVFNRSHLQCYVASCTKNILKAQVHYLFQPMIFAKSTRYIKHYVVESSQECVDRVFLNYQTNKIISNVCCLIFNQFICTKSNGYIKYYAKTSVKNAFTMCFYVNLCLQLIGVKLSA